MSLEVHLYSKTAYCTPHSPLTRGLPAAGPEGDRVLRIFDGVQTPGATVMILILGKTTLAVDWNAFNSAMQQSRDGNHLQAIAMLSALLTHCDSNRDRAAVLLGQSSCYSRLQNITKSRELLESAKMCAIEERDLLSQVELSDAALTALDGQHDLACERFASVNLTTATCLLFQRTTTSQWNWTRGWHVLSLRRAGTTMQSKSSKPFSGAMN